MIGLNTCPDCKEKFPEGRDHKCEEPAWPVIPEPCFRIGDKVIVKVVEAGVPNFKAVVSGCVWSHRTKQYDYEVIESGGDSIPIDGYTDDWLSPWSEDQGSGITIERRLEAISPNALFANYCPFEGQSYAANLQQAIEHHCRGEVIPEALAKRCPHHAKMLNDSLKANDQIQPANK